MVIIVQTELMCSHTIEQAPILDITTITRTGAIIIRTPAITAQILMEVRPTTITTNQNEALMLYSKALLACAKRAFSVWNTLRVMPIDPQWFSIP